MKKYILSFLVLFMSVGLIPNMVSAATVYLETSKNTVSVGDTFIVSAKIDAQKTSISNIEGDFVFDQNNDNLIINDYSLAKSIFSLWPQTPSPSEDGSTTSFAGGVPGGFQLDKAIIFNIVVEANKEGNITISPKNIAVFANDGKGTRVPVEVRGLEIKVVPKNEGVASVNEWSNLILSDKTNPENFDIVIGRETSLFEGKRFAFFTAVDNQSGISYYEVSEDGKPSIRSGSTYILANQDENVTPNLIVTAYDKAGNKTVSVYKEPKTTIFGFSVNFFIILLLLIIVWVVFKKISSIRRNKNNVQNNK